MTSRREFFRFSGLVTGGLLVACTGLENKNTQPTARSVTVTPRHSGTVTTPQATQAGGQAPEVTPTPEATPVPNEVGMDESVNQFSEAEVLAAKKSLEDLGYGRGVVLRERDGELVAGLEAENFRYHNHLGVFELETPPKTYLYQRFATWSPWVTDGENTYALLPTLIPDLRGVGHLTFRDDLKFLPVASTDLFITIDDGYWPENTEKILDLALQNQWKLNFFLNTNFLKENNEINRRLLKRILKEGHELGYHTSDHTKFGWNSMEWIDKDVTDYENYVQEMTGVNNYKVEMMRPPYGYWDSNWLRYGALTNRVTYHWNYYNEDPVDPKVRLPELRRQNQPAIVLLHTRPECVQWLKDNQVLISSLSKPKGLTEALTVTGTEESRPFVDRPGRIMLLGDSQMLITSLPQEIKSLLDREGISCEFIGSRNNNGIPVEGHGGFRTGDIYRDLADLDGDKTWNNSMIGQEINNPLQDFNNKHNVPDLVMTMLGTNDTGYLDYAQAQENLLGIIRFLGEKNPDVAVLLLPVPQVQNGNQGWNERIDDYNRMQKEVVTELQQMGVNIFFAGDLNPETQIQTIDGFHLSEEGVHEYMKIIGPAILSSLDVKVIQ